MNIAKDTDYDLVLEVVLREWKGKHACRINVNAAVPVPPQWHGNARGLAATGTPAQRT